MSWDFVRCFNLVEAVYWSALGIAAILVFRRRPPPIPSTATFLGCVLLVFGLSDAIEVATGAWWKPWWLAVMKVACGTGIGLLSWRLWRLIKFHRQTPQVAPAGSSDGPAS